MPIRQIIPTELTVLIHKCLQKNPAKRYQNFSGLRHDLSKIYVDLTGETIPEESAGELEAGELVNKGVELGTLGRSEEAILSFQKFIKFAPPQDASFVKKIEEIIQLLKSMV